jgi:hypothetical protein
VQFNDSFLCLISTTLIQTTLNLSVVTAVMSTHNTTFHMFSRQPAHARSSYTISHCCSSLPITDTEPKVKPRFRAVASTTNCRYKRRISFGHLLLCTVCGSQHTTVVTALTFSYVKSLHDFPRAGGGGKCKPRKLVMLIK